MLIGILSDTHDQAERTKVAVATLASAGAEALFHCGDITTADVVYECGILPAYFVFGNCDFDLDSLRQAIRQIGGHCWERGGLIDAGRPSDRHDPRRLRPGTPPPDRPDSPTTCSQATLIA